MLLLAIFLLLILFTLAVAFYRIIPSEFHSASKSREHVQAQYAADAGVRKGVQWLKGFSDSIPIAEIAAFNTLNSSANLGFNQEANFVGENWSYAVEITLRNGLMRVYDIRSTAYLRGIPKREALATVQNQTFAKYALFYHSWSDDIIFGMSSEGIQGPFHTNGIFRLMAPASNFWTDGQNPWVSGPWAEMTHAGQITPGDSSLGIAGDGNYYVGGNVLGSDPGMVPYDATTGSPLGDRYNRIIEGGREKIKHIEEITMPQANDDLRDKAWGSNTSTRPANNAQWNTLTSQVGNVIVNTSVGPNSPDGLVEGGIHIRGTADDTRLEITPEGHQKIRVRTGSTNLPGPPSISYFADTVQYECPFQPEPYMQPNWECTQWGTTQEPEMVTTTCTEIVFGQHPSCGTEVQVIPGEGGTFTTVAVTLSCEYENSWSCQQPTGNMIDVPTCVGDWVNNPIEVIPPLEWVQCQSGDSGAVAQNVTVPVDDPANPPDGIDPQDVYEVESSTTVNIQNWNSVVEVNDLEGSSPYQIPWLAEGVTVNGDLITDPNDSRLSVPDGHTVVIKHDQTQHGQYWGEYTVIAGRTNGIVFSDHDIRNLEGVNKGAVQVNENGDNEWIGRTIATNLTSNRDINIRNSILQYYDGFETNGDGESLNDGSNRLVPGNQSPNKNHVLGLITGRDVNLATQHQPSHISYQNNPGDPFRGLNVYAVIMAGRLNTDGIASGGFGTASNRMNVNSGLGDFNLYGGIISAVARSTQRAHAGPGTVTGFRMNLNYDWEASNALQNFPSTNIFNVLRYVLTEPQPN